MNEVLEGQEDADSRTARVVASNRIGQNLVSETLSSDAVAMRIRAEQEAMKGFAGAASCLKILPK